MCSFIFCVSLLPFSGNFPLGKDPSQTSLAFYLSNTSFPHLCKNETSKGVKLLTPIPFTL